MRYKDELIKIKIVVFDKSPLMRKLILDFFSNDPGVEIVGIFKSYSEISKFFNDTKCIVDCIILNLVFEKNFMNIFVDIRRYVSNIIFISDIDYERVKQVEDVLGLSNVKFLNYSGKLNLSDINTVKGEVLEEVYRIKNIRIKRALFDTKKAVVIASSTGGPKILEEIFKRIKTKLDIPVFIVQHMPDGCSEHFINRLIEMCNHEIHEGKHGEFIKPGIIYFAPSGYHMEVTFSNKIVLNTNDFVNSVRPSADVLFNSASKVYKEGLMAIVLTGMGKDGSSGIENVKENGGITIAQCERSCTVFGMPKAAIETGKVDMVLSVDKIVLEILKHSGKI